MSEVTVKTERISGTYHLKSTNASGNMVETDGSPDIGGEGKGARPMELLLMSLASCSVIDVILILKKQRQTLDDIKVDITAQRHSVENHSEYSSIHMHFSLYGQIKEQKAQKAIDLSLDEYCSVAQILKKSATITADFTILQEN